MRKTVYLIGEIKARFWTKVNVRGVNDCWLWTGAKTSKGYGRFKLNGSTVLAHRFALELDNRPPQNLFALHSCDNPSCVNPSHLRVGTHAENMQDCIARGRKNNPTGPRNGSVKRPDRLRRGIQHPQAKITEDDVRIIRTSLATEAELSVRFGVNRGTIGYIRRRQIWRHVK